MPRLNSANNANSTLATGITDIDTTLTVQDVSKFPAAPFRCTIYDVYPENGEIVEVSAVDRTASTFTVTRGMENTTAQSWGTGMKVGLLGTAGVYNELISTDDSRLSDARTPTIHDNTKHSATYVTQTEIDNSITTHAGNATAHHSNANDPTASEKAALAGTGIPSGTNVYVTNDDTRLSDARTPTSHDNTYHSETYITKVSDDTSPQLGGDLDANDKIIGKPVIKDYGEEIKAHGTTGGSITCDMQDGNIHTITLNANTTFTFSNPTASGDACSFTLMLTQDSTARTVTFPASVKWEGGSAPDLSTVSILYILTFITTDGGTTWYGWLAGSDFS